MRFNEFLFTTIFVFGFTPVQVLAEGQAKPESVQYAELATGRALNFIQGDLVSLLDAKDDFTSQGWGEFMKVLDGWLDDKGASKFSSNFIPSGKVIDIRLENEVLYLVIPGVLKHESRYPHGGVSTTAYRVEVKVKLVGKPLKIEQMKQITCGGANTTLSCR